ncbi:MULTISPECIES: alpha/beta hydrolase [unclassified Roseitalea]|uniref:alpha/beta fold hydrolase n=1 Tax=unclassified Roseitalea TaxID=2639107 RepID=UPI00273DDA96|nr:MULTISPECIES: alpha/beta hydrolase [unclassified Roseitalea]
MRERAGRAGSACVVFLHGSGFSSGVFDRQFASPDLAGLRLLAIDLPGHGASDPARDPAATYCFGGLAGVVGEVLAALDPGRVVLVGWSLGGHVALDMLDENPRVAGALIMGAPPLPANTLGSLRGLHFSRDMLLASKARFSQTDAARFERLCLGVYADGRHVPALRSVDPKARPMLARSVFFGHNRDQRAVAMNARKPLVIVHGEDDPVIRTSYMRSVIEAPQFGGRGHMLIGAGHAPFMQAQGRFEAILAEFVEDLAARSDRPAARGEPVRPSGRAAA